MYLFALSIGPVQEFIASARRSRDLWFGSWLLSELSKAAANQIIIIHNDRGRLIFPSTDDSNDMIPDSQFNVVNKILAIVDDPKATGEAVQEAVQRRLSDISDQTLSRIKAKDSEAYFLEDIARKQVKDMIEFFWSAYPLENQNAYPEAREKAETLLSARKSTRNFTSSDEWASNAPKSALDGQRESVIRDDAFDKLSAKQLRQRYGVRPGERLCGVGVLKRNGNRGNDDSFFSTSHVAALPLIERLKPDQHDLLDTYVGDLCAALHLDKESSDLGRVPYSDPYEPHPVFSRPVKGETIGYDGHILFAERLDDLIENKSEKQTAAADAEQARTALRKFLKDALGGETPSPYYALLLADGDNMGKVIDNISHIQIDELVDTEKHRRLSQELSAFAKGVSEIVVKKHQGSLVYAGGDDVLAFVPLHKVLQCGRDLADTFKTKLAKFNFREQENGNEYQPTLSVGVAIAHHLEPLQDTLTLVRKAERAAKKVDGKEALAIILSKRSGFDITIKGSWKTEGLKRPLDQRLRDFAKLHQAGDIPDGAAYELRDLWMRLNCDNNEPEYAKLQEAMRIEAVRILGRKNVKNEEVLKGLKRDIESEETSVEDLASELIVARVFAAAFDQANGKEGHG